jgi:hypothetical protein
MDTGQAFPPPISKKQSGSLKGQPVHPIGIAKKKHFDGLNKKKRKN